MKIHTKKGTDTILGATIVGGPAGDMICQLTNAIHHNQSLTKVGESIYPYPTYAEGIRHMADRYRGTTLTPAVRSAVRGLMSFKNW